MNIFVNLPLEFMRKIVLFSFWYDKIYIYDLWLFLYYIYDCSIINKNMIMKYIILY